MRRRRGDERRNGCPPRMARLVPGRLVGRTSRLAEFLFLSSHSLPRTREVKKGMGLPPPICAEVAKRQTQRTQNPPSASSCGFKSRPRHQKNQGVFGYSGR